MVDYVFQGLRDAAKDAVLLLFSPGMDPFPEDLTRNADRVFYFDGEPIAKTNLSRRVTQKAEELGHPGGVLMILQEFDTFFCTIYI